MAIKIKVSGVDRTGYLHNDSTTSWNLMRGARGTCQLPFLIPPADSFAPQVGDRIEIFDPPENRVWSGTAIGAEIRWIGNAGFHITTLTGVTIEGQLDTAELDKVKYGPGLDGGAPASAGEITRDLLTRSEATITAGTIDAGPTIESLEVTNVAEGLTTIALDAGFIWYVNPADETLNMHAPTARAAPWTLGKADVLWETLDWIQNQADQRNIQVLQLPMVARVPIVANFTGDGVTTAFVLPIAPDAVQKVSVTPRASGSTVSWPAAGKKIIITPPPGVGAAIVITYMDGGALTVGATGSPLSVIGSRRYTGTRSFTQDGGMQEALAMLATYSMLPSQLTLDTDKPGVSIGMALTIDIDKPVSAGAVLNGLWLVTEVEAVRLPGVDKLPEPLGHFRYTLHLVNSAATAIFQGDGSTTSFVLPITPTSASGIVTADGAFTVHFAGSLVTVTPAPPEGSALVVGYSGAATPNVPTFIDTWEGLAQTDTPTPNAMDSTPATDSAGVPPVFQRTLLIKDTTIGVDIADHVPVYHDGTSKRILGVLRKEISSDLTVVIHKSGGYLGSPDILATVTIPSATPVDSVLEWGVGGSPSYMTYGSPAGPIPFYDKEVLSADITASDGSKDVNGVASFTVEWDLVA